jgi:hypothetical protein
MKRFEVPATFSEVPTIPAPIRVPVPKIFVETIFARFEVPDTFSEVILADVPEMFDAMRFAETIFARLLVPLIFSEVPI